MALTTIQWDGKSYRFDLDSPDVRQMVAMRLFTGMNWLPMLGEMQEGNDRCLTAALWLMLQQNGEVCNIEQVPWPEGKGPLNLLYALQAGEPVGVADPNSKTASSTPSSPGSHPDPKASISEDSGPVISTPSPDLGSHPQPSTG